MAIKSIDLAWISTKDMKKAKAFFADKLGLKIISDSPEYGWMEFTGSECGASLGVGQDTKECDVKAGQNAIVTFTVDDIEKTKADLKAKGVTIVGDIMEVPGHVKLLYIKDEDGNLFHLAQPLGEQPSQGCC
jgi:predicted enzyme related to lactoylglutathione lyase